MNEKSMYVVQEGELIVLRQTRFKATLASGREHPHDVCAVAFSVDQMRSMVDIPGLWHNDVDWTAVQTKDQ